MKRRLLTIAICVLFGAVVNVAVAWGIAIWSCPIPTCIENFREVEQSDIESLWQHYGQPSWPSFSGGTRMSAAGRTITKVDGWISGRPSIDLTRYEIGWPGRAMRCVDILWGGPYGQWEIVEGWYLEDGIPWVARRTIILPLAPVWTGFAVNTVFYAAVLWLLISSPFALRGFLRLRRGLCPKCAYPMGESSVCSECGITLPRRRMPNLT